MAGIKELINQHKDKFNLLLFAGGLIAAFNCLARPDYNIVSYAYIYYVWFMIDDRVIYLQYF